MESTELFAPYSFIRRRSTEICLLADLLYFALTTLRRRQTLGEEYCNIMPMVGADGRFPGMVRRLGYFLVSSMGPFMVK